MAAARAAASWVLAAGPDIRGDRDFMLEFAARGGEAAAAVAQAASVKLKEDPAFMLAVLSHFEEQQWMRTLRGGHAMGHASVWVSQNYAAHKWKTVNDDTIKIEEGAGSPFRVVPGLTGEKGTVSFQDAARPCHYLRHAGFAMRCHSGGGPFVLDATFRPRPALTGHPGFVSYESVNYPGRFISHRGFVLRIEHAEDSTLHRNDASFRNQFPNGIGNNSSVVIPAGLSGNRDFLLGLMALGPTAACVAGMHCSGGCSTSTAAMFHIKTHHGKFLVVKGNDVDGNNQNAGPRCGFHFEEKGGGKVSLKCHTGKYLCMEPGGGRVICDRGAAGAWETFQFESKGGNRFALRNVQGKYLCCEGAGNLIANRDACGHWEIFERHQVGGHHGGQHGATHCIKDSPLSADREFMLSLVAAGWQAALVAAAHAPRELCSDPTFMRAVLDAQPWDSTCQTGSNSGSEGEDDQSGSGLDSSEWRPIWPDREGVLPELRLQAVTLAGLVRCAAEHSAFESRGGLVVPLAAGQQYMLAAVARSGAIVEEMQLHFRDHLARAERNFIELAATISELTHGQPAHRHAICTAMARGLSAAQAVATVQRNLLLPLSLVDLSGESYPVIGWLESEPHDGLQTDWIDLAKRQHPSLRDAPFHIVLNDDAPDSVLSGKFASARARISAVGALLASADPPQTVLMWTDTDQ
jgi:hypothetical protein